MNNAFVNLRTVYDDKSEISLDYLTKCYNDVDKLQKIVNSLLSTSITETAIKGKNVMLKPNWVKEDTAPYDSVCLRTNDNLLLCVVRYLVSLSPAKLLVADAPIQDCNWDLMLKSEVRKELENISAESHVPILIKDLRRVQTNFHENTTSRDLHGMDEYLIFDMGEKSNLEPITDNKKSFRVTNYDPDKMAKVHSKGVHKYCIAKEVFDYDVIITMPKTKTHRMAGLTNSLKILIGINGDKEYLPHHRIGAKESGGDCYKGKNPLRHLAELLSDASNRHIGKWQFHLLRRSAILCWLLSFPGKKRFLNAGWYGNDTIWRTVLDLNYVAAYGKNDGTIADTPQRQLLTICDEIVCGQGDGPLYPKPLPMGIIAVSNNAYLMDIVAGTLMDLNIDKIPLLKAATDIVGGKSFTIMMNDRSVSLKDLRAYAVKAELPPGWVDYNKQ